jgi:glycosyltransferase involved in cell wall biosynthesis
VGLTILSIAYTHAPVGPDVSGGAEQILHLLDRALVARGHRSVVVAQAGSSIAGELVAYRGADGLIDGVARAAAERRARAAVDEALLGCRPDVVHMHGIDFATTLPPAGPPVVVSLHLPVATYGEALRIERPDLWLLPVSRTQARGAAALPGLLTPIENGIDVEAFTPAIDIPLARREHALVLARICPEKGIHLAIDATRAAGLPILIGGEVFPYPAHLSYFHAEIRPRLGPDVRYLGAVGAAEKRRLLAAARCLIVASTIDETSSLVAREAAASGTPVVALDRGALAETVEHGRTGLIVAEPGDLAAAIQAVGTINPATCRAVARLRFSAAAMAERTITLYRDLAEGRRPPCFDDGTGAPVEGDVAWATPRDQARPQSRWESIR